jgi:predicted RecB family nuclease
MSGYAMVTHAAVTLDLLDGYLNCKYKAYLRSAGHEGIKSEYEAMLIESRRELRLKAIEKIQTQHPEHAHAKGVALTRSALSKATPFILDADLRDDCFSVHFDGLKKVDGRSDLGDFHYQPVLFYEGRHIRKAQRLLLEVLGLLLSRVQGKTPSRGVIYHGSEGTPTMVRFSADLKAAEILLSEILRMQQGDVAPKLLLNDHCPICEFRPKCRAQAMKEDHLSLLRGLGEKEIKSYGRKGVFTLTQLAHTFRPRRGGKRSDRHSTHRYHALQALAIRDKRVYVLGAPNVPSGAVRIYLDAEGKPAEGYVYLLGMIVCEGDAEHRYSFWADSKDKERDIFERFLAVVSRYDSPYVFCYGSYERAFINRMRRHARRKKPVDKVLDALVNTLSIIYTHFYFPTYSNGLKEVGGCLGCAWSDENASGIQSIAWRMQWERTHDDQWKAKLIQYNLEDCAALRSVTDFLGAACAGIPTPADALTPDAVGLPPVVRVQDLDKLAYPQKWRRTTFLNADFEFVNNCAYFDYQRQRVFVRTSKTLKKHRRRPGLHLNRRIRANRRVEITASKCPACGDTKLLNMPTRGLINGVQPRVKRAFDLVITADGMRRQVIECRAAAYRCTRCSHCFTSERYQRLAKHFHGLMSWAIYQHIAHRLSSRTLQEMFREFFGLTISSVEIHMFKSLIARYYRPTYRKLIAKIVSGPVLHADETEVKLRSGKGYVWVFTNLEEVVFMYKPTREGEFLREMLKEFEGVLVSDFYAVYDSLGCAQQKCLIHLIRDINQEILNHPFDEELQSVTQAFGSLLRSIVTTIDEHGLKRTHLERHAGKIAEFFRALSARSFRSESAQALQKRMVKYQDKLFTFIRHDGVPWNNNNAENAIKRFAYYREDTVGIMREAGLNDYLMLLSLYMTCRFKGISFLKFLLSKERDIDAFSARPRMRRRSPDLELYPKGFIPPHLAGARRKVAEQRRVTPATYANAGSPSGLCEAVGEDMVEVERVGEERLAHVDDIISA